MVKQLPIDSDDVPNPSATFIDFVGINSQDLERSRRSSV